GCVLEMYSYRDLAASVTPRGNLSSCDILKLDSFLDSLEALTQYSTYGVYFGCGHSIFEFIPRISSIITQQLSEGATGAQCSEAYNNYKILEFELCAWKPTGSEMTSDQVAAAIIYQNALLFYLQSAFYSFLDAPSLLSEIEARIGVCLPLLLSLSPSRLEGICLWPTMIIGSCLRKDEDKKILSEGLERSVYKMKGVRNCLQLLELWEDDIVSAFGPQGLHYVMKKMGWNLCLS
ncbi:hypothetical protein BKA64DRAFT_562848, partial [Cadophora sp. MPI-SDFR-AT-0126]